RAPPPPPDWPSPKIEVGVAVLLPAISVSPRLVAKNSAPRIAVVRGSALPARVPVRKFHDLYAGSGRKTVLSAAEGELLLDAEELAHVLDLLGRKILLHPIRAPVEG